MGWTYQYDRPRDAKAELRSHYEWSDSNGTRKVLADALKLDAYYCAVEQTLADGSREVWAGVALVDQKRHKDGYNFGIKEMDETVGPYEADCPERILKLLTPTDNEYALKWREACRANLARRKANRLTDGAKVTFNCTYGAYGNQFIARRRRNRWYFDAVNGMGQTRLGSYRRNIESVEAK